MTGLNISHLQISKNTIRVAGILEESIVDGPGVRLVVFTQGCKHQCTGCHNPETHDFSGGYDIVIEEILTRLKENPMIDGITLSGGDPFEQAESCSILASRAKVLGYNVVAYTGYTYEILLKNKKHLQLLQYVDILIDGRFEIEKMDLTLAFRGSSNQRILYMQEQKDKKELTPREGIYATETLGNSI